MSLSDRSVRLEVLKLRNKRLLQDQKNVPLSSVLSNRQWSRPEDMEATLSGGMKKQSQQDREDEKLAMEVKGLEGKGGCGRAIGSGKQTEKDREDERLGEEVGRLEGHGYTGASARKLGEEYAKEILENEPHLRGSGFFGDFWDGFRGSIAGLGDTITNVVKKIPGPIGSVGGMVGDALTGTMKALPAYKKKYEDDPTIKKAHDIAMKVGDIAGEAGKGPAGMLAKAVGSGPKKKKGKKRGREDAGAAAGGEEEESLNDLMRKRETGEITTREFQKRAEKLVSKDKAKKLAKMMVRGQFGSGKKQGEKDREDEKLAMEVKGVKDKVKKGKGKRKMNAYMSAVQKARKSGAKSFEYKGKKYVRATTKTGMVIFRKA